MTMVGKGWRLNCNRDLHVLFPADLLRPTAERRQLLQNSWGFVCQCQRCCSEEAPSPARHQLWESYCQLLQKEGHDADGAAVAEQLLASLQQASVADVLAARIAADAHLYLTDWHRQRGLTLRGDEVKQLQVQHLRRALHGLLGCVGDGTCTCDHGRRCPRLFSLLHIHHRLERLQAHVADAK